MTVSPPDAIRRVLCLAGSLRRDSYNRRLLQVASIHAPASLQLHVYDQLSLVPLFNEDLEQRNVHGPAGVLALRRAIAAADGLVIATPEYNHAMPGVLKNALDWLSRDSPTGEVLTEKPVAVLGITGGSWGTRLAQASLRQVLHTCGALVMPAPSVFVAHAASQFDDAGMLVDPALATSLQAFLLAFERWMLRMAIEPMQARP